MSTLQVDYTEAELLADHDYAEPLVVKGVRCHGGFDADGRYRSPRTLHRTEAIRAWEAQRLEQFSTPLLDIPLETWPETFPNVEQSKFLLSHGVRDPTISALTRIGTVEGFGGILRVLPVPDFQKSFDEDIAGTAVAHIDDGLFEAHARDEAGHGDQAGHNTMWFVARDIAFEDPVTEDQTARMLARMGVASGTRSKEELADLQEAARAQRCLPGDIDLTLELLVGRMIGLLLIEISAFHGFAWAEAVLGDPDLVAGDGEAARIISYVRADETPHVDWLRTALSEMRDRTWVGDGGARHDGTEMIGLLWDRALRDSVVLRRADALALALSEIERATAGRPDADDLLDEMLSLGRVARRPDGTLGDLGDRTPGAGGHPGATR
ncbi:MAG: hypothetical protein ACLP9C_05400 [Acidimicrobiales bacterium]